MFLIDIDVAPSLGLRDGFNIFAHKHDLYSDKSEKIVFVIPVFERKKGIPAPNTKNELLAGCEEKTIRPFHNAVK